MKFAIFTHVQHGYFAQQYFAYAPYVREMNVWAKFVDEIIIVAPLVQSEPTKIDLFYESSNINVKSIPLINFTSLIQAVRSLLMFPRIIYQIVNAMAEADHIHLRCPGNIGLLACIVQIFFPKKFKTAKYAGNWDPKAKQPMSYRLQKWILNNTFLTKNMQIMVYGEWEGSSPNVKPFFTASYWEADKIPIEPRNLVGKINFVFAGTLSEGKRPLYAVEIVERLQQEGVNVALDIFGDGKERATLEEYILDKNLESTIKLHGNQDEHVLRMAYQQAHFMILPSKSEGWPKVVAEAMFWGCVPVSSAVSCVPFMLDYGERGLLLQMSLNEDVQKIMSLLADHEQYRRKAVAGILWSRKYTMDFFQQEIKRLIHG